MSSINLTTIVLTIFVVCAGFVLLRGTLKILLGCLVLGVSAWLGFRVWQQAPELVKACFGTHISWLATVLPIATFLITFIVGRTIVKFFSSPFRKIQDDRPPLTLTRLLGAALFTLIPTCLIGLILTILIYHAGAVAEISTTTGKSPPSATSSLVQNLKASIEKSIPASWLQLVDPLADPSRLALAKIITAQSQPVLKPDIDPQTGRPIPRAVLVRDAELQGLAREGKFATLLRSPLLTKYLNDPSIQAFLKKLGN